MTIGRGPLAARHRLLPALALALAATAALAADGPAPYARLTAVKTHRLKLGWHLSDGWTEVKQQGDCTTTSTFKIGLEASASVRLEIARVSNKGIYQWKQRRGGVPEGQLTYDYRFHSVRSCPGRPDQVYFQNGSGGGVGVGDGRFDLDVREGTFRATGFIGAKDGHVTDSVLGRQPGGVTLAPGVDGGEMKGTVGREASRVHAGNITMAAPLALAWVRKPMVFEWSVEPWEDSELPEVSVEADAAFDRWVPTGNLKDQDQPGARVAVRVKVHAAGDPAERADVLARLKFTLEDVSQEPGVCMNWPRERPGREDDLRILQEENEGLNVTDGRHAETRDLVMGAAVVISSFDYGAFGRLRVTAEDPKGRALRVRVRGQEGIPLEVPRDDDGDHVADAWEKEKGVSGQGGDADDEAEPPGNGFPGDGLTLYEEYRGFAEKGLHASSDPKRKDLFVADQTSGQVAEPAVALFEKASGLVVHRVTPEELDEDVRVINPNHGAEPHAVDQHGLLVIDGPPGGDPGQVPVDDSKPFGPPRLTSAIELPRGGAFGSGRGLEDAAHELGHGVGMAHHGEGALWAVFWQWVPAAGGGVELREWGATVDAKMQKLGAGRTIQLFQEPPEGGVPTPVKPGSSLPGGGGFEWRAGDQGWRLILTTQGGEFGGDPECLMRYADKQAFHRRGDEANRYLVDQSQTPARSRFCDGQQGTGVNGKGHVPFSRGGDATVGNCRGQLVVNDQSGAGR